MLFKWVAPRLVRLREVAAYGLARVVRVVVAQHGAARNVDVTGVIIVRVRHHKADIAVLIIKWSELVGRYVAVITKVAHPRGILPLRLLGSVPLLDLSSDIALARVDAVATVHHGLFSAFFWITSRWLIVDVVISFLTH